VGKVLGTLTGMPEPAVAAEATVDPKKITALAFSIGHGFLHGQKAYGRMLEN
jgi:hypothetical protein